MMQTDVLKLKQDKIETSKPSIDSSMQQNAKTKQLDITKLPCFKCEWRYSIHCPKCQWNKDGNINTY